MKKLAKKLFYKLVGERIYLKTLKWGFRKYYKYDFLKNDEIYKWHYFVPRLIRKGDYIVDLGANLGYYTDIFSDLAGATGRVFSVEPIPLFYDILVSSLKHDNVTTYNNALGEEERNIKMSIPYGDGYLRTGLAHIEDSTEDKNILQKEFEVKMVRGSKLLGGLTRLDYLKCDIEGYEGIVLTEMSEIIARLRPVMQVETWGTSKNKVDYLLAGLDYKTYILFNNQLIPYTPSDIYPGDFLFIPKEKETEIIARSKKGS